VPELPEAETIVRGLRRLVPGRTVVDVRIVHDDVLRGDPGALRRGVIGRTFTAVDRRGKNVVFLLDDGSRLVVNLGMTGRLLAVSAEPEPAGEARAALRPEATHPAVRFALDDGRHLVFDDVRRFGTLELLSPDGWREREARMGPEPLSDGFTTDVLAERLDRSRAPVRSWLLDQRRIAGIGNIYAAEALWRARVDPTRPARSLERDEARRLHRSLREVLRRAVEAGGTTLRDYRDAEGREGAFGRQLSVYGREGEPCSRCGTTIERVVFSSRSAFFCPVCQR